MTLRVFGILGLTLVILAAAVAFRADSPNDPPAITPLPATHPTNGPIYWKGNRHTQSHPFLL